MYRAIGEFQRLSFTEQSGIYFYESDQFHQFRCFVTSNTRFSIMCMNICESVVFLSSGIIGCLSEVVSCKHN